MSLIVLNGWWVQRVYRFNHFCWASSLGLEKISLVFFASNIGLLGLQQNSGWDSCIVFMAQSCIWDSKFWSILLIHRRLCRACIVRQWFTDYLRLNWREKVFLIPTRWIGCLIGRQEASITFKFFLNATFTTLTPQNRLMLQGLMAIFSPLFEFLWHKLHVYSVFAKDLLGDWCFFDNGLYYVAKLFVHGLRQR